MILKRPEAYGLLQAAHQSTEALFPGKDLIEHTAFLEVGIFGLLPATEDIFYLDQADLGEIISIGCFDFRVMNTVVE